MFFTNRLFMPFLNMEDFFFNSSVKDMQPYSVYSKGNDYIIEVKTLGIDPKDISVTIKDNILEITGETPSPYGETAFNTRVRLSIENRVLSQLESIKYKSYNGITYITLKMKQEKQSNIRIEKE